MAESLWDLTLRAALAETASKSPTPGGGSIAPLTGAFGLGLVLMSLEVTQAKKTDAELTQALDQGRGLLKELEPQPDHDVAVFQAYIRALALPKTNEAEQRARDEARQQAVLSASEAPLSAADVLLRALAFAESVRAVVHENVRCDLVAGADLVYGAIHATLRALEVNLPALRDAEQRAALAAHATDIEASAQDIYERIIAQR
jgi:formiminotetrahydrofolate cyclodeaminase